MIVQIDDPEYEKKYGKKIEYFMEDRLVKATDEKIKVALSKKDKDFFAIVDGTEGSGKSTMSLQWAKYVDPSFNISRICFTPDEFKEAIFKAKKGQAIVYDEAFTGLGSRSALSSVNRYLVSLAMQVRQKNLFIILALPSVFLLDKYFVMFRTKVLVHIYENKGRRGYFRIYNPKKIKRLILEGKSTYSYSKKVYTHFKGRFYGKFALGDELEEAYKDRKLKALKSVETNPMTAAQVKYKEQRDLFIYLLRKNAKLTYREISNLLLDYNVDISYVQIRNICSKFGDEDKQDIINEKKRMRDEEIEEKRLKKAKKMKKLKEIEDIEEESEDIEPFDEENDDFEPKEEEIEDIETEGDGEL